MVSTLGTSATSGAMADAKGWDVGISTYENSGSLANHLDHLEDIALPRRSDLIRTSSMYCSGARMNSSLCRNWTATYFFYAFVCCDILGSSDPLSPRPLQDHSTHRASQTWIVPTSSSLSRSCLWGICPQRTSASPRKLSIMCGPSVAERWRLNLQKMHKHVTSVHQHLRDPQWPTMQPQREASRSF